jgi:PAS domain S-box-containing protein
MDSTQKKRPHSPADVLTKSVLAGIILVGISVIAGWHLQVRVLVQVFSGVIPMQYNTALCFIVLAASAWLLVARRGHWLMPGLGGAFVSLMGALVIYQYATGRSIGIDTLFFYPWLQTLSANPGRMALTTALSFFGSGVALLLLSFYRTKFSSFAILHTVPTSLGLTSTMGYVVGVTLVLPFNLGSQMAVHTAFAFFAYGSVMLIYAWRQAARRQRGAPRWVSAVGILIVPILFVGVSISAELTMFATIIFVMMGLLAGGLFAVVTHRLTSSNINRKGLILVSVPLLFLFGFVVLVSQLSRRSQEAEAAYIQSKEIISTLETISTDLFEAESSIRGYVLTADPAFAKSFNRQEVPEAVARLEKLVQDNPAQRARVLELRAKTIEKLELQDRLKQLVQTGSKDEARELISSARGLHLMNEISRIKAAFLEEEYRLDTERQRTARTSWQTFNWLLVAGSSIDLFLAVILALLFSSGISKRIVALTENARALAKGEKLAKTMNGTDEIAQMDHVFHEMAEALDEAAKKEGAIFQNAIDVICTLDAKGRFLRVSPSCLRVWGYRPEELVGRAYTDLLLPEEHERSAQADRELLEGKPLTDFENRYRRKDGAVIDMLWSACWSETDQAVFAMARDITERKRNETALRESEERYRLLFNGNPHPIWVYDVETLAFLAINEAAIRRYGYSREEFLSRTIKDIRPAEDVPVLLENVSKEDGINEPRTWRHRKKNGEIIYVEIASHELIFGGRKAEIVLANDITERKRAEDAVKELNASLEKRTIQLEETNKELEAFSYSVSHDLRAPLRAIDGFSRILLEDYADKLDENGNRVLGVVRTNAQNMGQLIDDLLTFSRLGRKAVELLPIDMTDLAKSAFEDLNASDSDRRLQLKIANIPPARGDRALMRQVFINLLSNATKYSRKKERPLIEVGGRTENGSNLYFVKDNGAGFDMQYANKLFGVFQRLHGPEEFEGTGVGLAIVQRIIHRHGGRVWAESKINEGATFYFTLPKENDSNATYTKPE